MYGAKTIYDFIVSQEAAFSSPIILNETWEWSFKEHVRKSKLYKHSELTSGDKEFKPVKNITRPILNVQYRSEGFDVKDVILYVDDKEQYYKSFVIKKFWEKFAREHGLDTVIDEMVESYVDYGGALLKNVDGVRPEVVPLESIAFCDQTDILSGPIGIKHYFSPDQLLAMADVGWGEESNGATASIKDVIRLAREEKRQDKDGITTKTPGKYIEVYEVHGNFPKSFLNPTDSDEDYSNQLHICAFYQKKDSYEKGYITLFRAEESKSPFKLILRDKIFGRALGFGGAEELFDPQVWTNYAEIRMQELLDASSKIILKSIGAELKSKYPNGLKDMDNLEIIELGAGEDLAQVDTVPRSISLFERNKIDWKDQAQTMGAATDALLGETPQSGTPFALQDLITRQGQGLHDYRKGKLAVFWDEIMRDWIIPYIVKQVTKDQEFLAELDLDEVQFVSERMSQKLVNDYAKEKILSGLLVSKEEMDALKQEAIDEFKKRGNKHFIQIFKGEMKNAPITVKTSIAGKQKNLAQDVNKLVNIFRFAFSNPQGFAATMQIPGMAKAFNGILELSGLSPVDFAGADKMLEKAQETQNPLQPKQGQPSPLQPNPEVANA